MTGTGLPSTGIHRRTTGLPGETDAAVAVEFRLTAESTGKKSATGTGSRSSIPVGT